MLTLLPPEKSGLFDAFVSDLNVGANDQLMLSLVSRLQPKHYAIGVCFSGAHSTEFLVVEVQLGDDTFVQLQPEFPMNLQFCALEDNPFNFVPGDTYALTITSAKDNSTEESLFAHSIDANMQPITLSVCAEKQPVIATTHEARMCACRAHAQSVDKPGIRVAPLSCGVGRGACARQPHGRFARMHGPRCGEPVASGGVHGRRGAPQVQARR
jgi:hypothetical protein